MRGGGVVDGGGVLGGAMVRGRGGGRICWTRIARGGEEKRTKEAKEPSIKVETCLGKGVEERHIYNEGETTPRYR